METISPIQCSTPRKVWTGILVNPFLKNRFQNVQDFSWPGCLLVNNICADRKRMNVSLREGALLATLKEDIWNWIHPLFRLLISSSWAIHLIRSWPGNTRYFVGTVYLHIFQSAFRPGFGTETAFTPLMDDLYQKKGRASPTLLFFLHPSATLFIAYDILEELPGKGISNTVF